MKLFLLFLRMSRALKESGIVGAALVWSLFFDDLMSVSRSEDSESADVACVFYSRLAGGSCQRTYRGGPNSVSKNHISFRC